MLFTQWKIKQLKSKTTREKRVTVIVSIKTSQSQDIALSFLVPYDVKTHYGRIRVEKYSGSVSTFD